MTPTKRVVGTKLAMTAITRATRAGCPNHPIELKRRLAALACQPGVSVARLALDHGLNANLVFKWRRQYRAGKFGGALSEEARAGKETGTATKLLPVLTVAPHRTQQRVESGSAPPSIEIVLCRATVRIAGEVSASTLKTVLDCLGHHR